MVITVPPVIEAAMQAGAALAISVSGGKDSQVLARVISRLHRERGWTGPLLAIHADLGRVEHRGTPGHTKRIARESGLELEIVRRRDGQGKWDMVDRWIERGETLEAQGRQGRPWSDAGNRFCTAEMKRDPINKLLRRYESVVSVEGIRAEESPARAKKPEWEVRKRITTRTRTAFTWNPILAWTLEDVLRELGSSIQDLERRRDLFKANDVVAAFDGWQAHPVYVMGNQRLSCAFCVLGCKSDLQNAVRLEPELYEELVGIEERFGFSFQAHRSLASLREAAP